MRSTQDVAQKQDSGLGHYSDPPLLVLASLASGPKHGHAMIEDIVRFAEPVSGRERYTERLPAWSSRVGSSHFPLRSDAGPIALLLWVCAFSAPN